jgi:tRNA A58 N-methylase Trm61
MWSGIKSKVPFISIPYPVLPYIFKALNIKKDSIVFDLGCGDGRMLFYSANLEPEAEYIGIENGPLPLFFSRVNMWQNRVKHKTKNKIKIINDDFFKQDLSKATHIFLYLYPNIMDDLLPKFDKELKSGTKVVSVSFQFTLKRPMAEIDLKRSGFLKIAQKLYIYEF